MFASRTSPSRSGRWPPPVPSTWYAWTVRPAIAATVSSSSADSWSPSVWSATAIPRASANDSAASIISGYAPKSSWIFRPIAPASTSGSRSAGVLRSGAGLEPDVDRPRLEPGERPLHRPRRLLEAGRDERRHAAGQRRGQQLRADRVDVAVDRAGRRDQAVAGDRHRVRADVELDPVADRWVAGPTDADDPAVLDADVGLDDADRRVDDDRAGHDHVELRRARPARLGHPVAQVLRVAPLRLVAGRLAVLGDADPEIAVGEADAVAGRRPVAGEVLLGGEAAHRPSPPYAHQVDVPGLARRPAERVAGRQVEPEAGGRRPIEREPRVDPFERVVRGDPDRPPRVVPDGQPDPLAVRSVTARRRRGSPRPGPGPAKSSPPPSGSTRTTNRVPSPMSTSSRTSSTSSRTPDMTSIGRNGAPPGRLDLLVARPGPRRLEHRVAHQRDRLGRVQREPGRPVAPRQLGRREDQQPLLFPIRQAHAAIVGRRASRDDGPRKVPARHSSLCQSVDTRP